MSEKLEPNMEDEKNTAEKQYRDTLLTLGNLSKEEVTKLVDFEFYVGPSSVDDQVKRYYLKLKSERPKKAEEMQSEIEPIIKKRIASQADVKGLCLALYKYWSGFLINFEGHSYSVHNSKLNIDGKEVE